MLQRLCAGGALVYGGYACLSADPMCAASLTRAVGALAGALLIAGLWTPIAGGMAAILEVSVAVMSPGRVWISLFLAVLGATLAMIGPGTWSIDAWVFGRKRIVPPEL